MSLEIGTVAIIAFAAYMVGLHSGWHIAKKTDC